MVGWNRRASDRSHLSVNYAVKYRASMQKHTITIERDGPRGFLATQQVGTDALNALSSIDGVNDPEIVWETEDRVQVSYSWSGKEAFLGTGDVLGQYGLKRTDI